MIAQFKAKQKTLQFSALLIFSLWLALFFLAVFYPMAAPPDPVSQAILIGLWLLTFSTMYRMMAYF